MKKKRFFSLVCLISIMGFLFLFALPANTPAGERYIVHATGGTAGTYFPIGGGMAELMTEIHHPHICSIKK